MYIKIKEIKGYLQNYQVVASGIESYNDEAFIFLGAEI